MGLFSFGTKAREKRGSAVLIFLGIVPLVVSIK
jgi:hypothetical protein